MKKNISIFLLGIFASICIGAGISNSELLTVKPATPKSVISKSFAMWRDNAEYNGVSLYILENTKKGYIVKSCSGAGNSSLWIVVMEKY